MLLPGADPAGRTVADHLDILADGTVIVRTGKVELGQGLTTAFAQIVASILDVPVASIRIVSGDTAGPNDWYTAGSLSVEHGGAMLARAARAARQAMLAEATRRTNAEAVWGHGHVRAGTRAFALHDLAQTALSAPLDAAAADLHTGGLCGISLPRLDLPVRIGGTPFIQDLAFPGLLHGRVLRRPHAGALLGSIASDTVEFMPGMVKLVRDGQFIGVIARTAHEADAALRKLTRQARWQVPPMPDPVALVRGAVRASTETLIDRPGTDWTAETLRARFSRPFLAHASIGTSCAVARVDAAGIEVWTHSQGVFALRQALATMLGRNAADIHVRHHPNAGCYGHNGADDAAADAVLLARAVPGQTVRVLWSREDELSAAPLGSAMTVEIGARLAENRIATMEIVTTSGTHGLRPGANGAVNLLAGCDLERPFPINPAPSDLPPAMGGGADRNAAPIYDIPALRVVRRTVPLPVRTSSLRALGAHVNVFAIEAMMDDLAIQAGLDPLAFRLSHLADPRARHVLREVAALAGYPDAGRALGLGFARYKNKAAYCAVVAEVEIDEAVRVPRVWCCFDGGFLVNPDGAANQIEGGIVQSLSWTLHEAVRFDETGVSSRDWESYPILTFGDAPDLRVVSVGDPSHPPLGVGEAAQGPTAAALGNAVAAALGARIHDMPFTRERLVAALA
jgi:CO/xanthine dehydrogenase Mo-binding subunit